MVFYTFQNRKLIYLKKKGWYYNIKINCVIWELKSNNDTTCKSLKIKH